MTDTSTAPVQPSVLPDPAVDGAYYVESSTAAYYHVDNEYVLQHPATVPADAHVFTLTNGAWVETSPGATQAAPATPDTTQPTQDTPNAGQLDPAAAAPQAGQDSSAVQAPVVAAQPAQEAPVTTDAAPTTPAPADTAAQPVPAQDSAAAPVADQSSTAAAPADAQAPQAAAPAAVVDTTVVTTPAPDAPTAGAPADTSTQVVQDAASQPAPADQSAAPAVDASAAAAPVAPATPDTAQAPATPADAAVAAPVAAPAADAAPADAAPAVAAPAAQPQPAPAVQADAAVAALVAPQADVQAAAPVEAPKSEEEQYLDDIKANGTDAQKKVLAAIETFADRLQPHKPILASDGAKHQHEFLKWLLWALEKDYEAFRGAWNVLLVYMQVHHGYNTASKFSALSEFSTNRFLFAWTKGEDHCRAYTSLMTLLRATRNRETRQHDIKTIRLESVAPGLISEKALNNLKAFYQV